MPRRFLSVFNEYEAVSVPYMGWAGKKNGVLLKLMIEAGFDAFVTVDQNLQYQQNLQKANISILVLHAATNSYDDLLTLAPAIHATIANLQPSKIYVIK
jgi:hypothetical protein